MDPGPCVLYHSGGTKRRSAPAFRFWWEIRRNLGFPGMLDIFLRGEPLPQKTYIPGAKSWNQWDCEFGGGGYDVPMCGAQFPDFTGQKKTGALGSSLGKYVFPEPPAAPGKALAKGEPRFFAPPFGW